MKRYISAVLVPCFLLQLLAGCYSYEGITLDELQKYYGPNDIRITTDKDKIVINRQSTGDSKMDWRTNDSSIIVQYKEFVRNVDSSKVIEKNIKINYTDILSLELSKYDGLKSGLFIGGSIIVGLIIIIAVGYATSNWNAM